VFVIWDFISFPLCVGRNWSGDPNNPCRVKTIPHPIPEKKWYLTPIFVEMYFVFTSFWNYKVYYVYVFMLRVFLILVVITVCVAIVGTYFLLNAENWQIVAMDFILLCCIDCHLCVPLLYLLLLYENLDVRLLPN
ncbi:hypothetical protein MKW92_009678, partial [Papaver armeniacum]